MPTISLEKHWPMNSLYSRVTLVLARHRDDGPFMSVNTWLHLRPMGIAPVSYIADYINLSGGP
jgi:hypothetical protein